MTGAAAIDKAAKWFAEHFGRTPEGVWRAPGRVNLIGEHTDYNQGFVLPMAISAGVTVCAARRTDGYLVLSSRQAGQAVVALNGLAPGLATGWSAYPAGVAWALREAGYPVGGASLGIDADLPMGAGLSSSAALECAIALALTGLYGLSVPRRELAALASRAENDFVGAPTGLMDQSASLLCRAGQALLLDCRSGADAALPLNLHSARMSLMIIDTRIRHALTDGRYATRRAECEAAARTLGAASLRDITDSRQRLADLGDQLLKRRATHVVAENQRVLQAAELLRTRQIVDIGALLSQSHASLRDDFEVSWPQADAAVDAALAAGAAGARMMGGGFGGSVLALLPVSLADSVMTSVMRCFARHDWHAPGFLSAVPSAGAHRLRVSHRHAVN